MCSLCDQSYNIKTDNAHLYIFNNRNYIDSIYNKKIRSVTSVSIPIDMHCYQLY